MKYIECPKAYRLNQFDSFPVIFLAGGITGCPDWQAEMMHALQDKDVVILNPRRATFPDFLDIDLAHEQIQWEFNMMRRSTCISFWFCAETIQPIVLYELGNWIMYMQMKPTGVLPETILIGVDPAYSRRIDIEEQIACSKLPITIATSLDDHIHNVHDYIDKWWKSEPYILWFQSYFKNKKH
jgi:hypothetical protein